MGVTTVIKDYGTEILNAIRANDLQRLKNILEKHLRMDRKIQKLCISDIKHKPTKKFACPIILAARQEDPKIMKYMLERGVDPNFVHHTIFSSKRRETVTALHISADLGHYDTVQALLDANADCNIDDHNQETPLHIAVKKADRVMTRMLLSKGADPCKPDRRGNAALHIATLYGHLQLVRSLLKYDADVYQKGQWNAIPPHIAAKEGHIHLIQLFCSRDVGNINIKIPCYHDNREKSPIHLAAENGHVETVFALLDQFQAEVNLKDSDHNTPLHCVVLNQYDPHRMRDKEYFNETAKVLMKFGVSINGKNAYGDTALHLAAMNQFQRIVELLLEMGANPFLENDERLKPIDVVPDFDPVTKQVLKNGMLNPRPLLNRSRETLMSRGSSLNQSQMSIVKKPLSNGTKSSSSGTQDNLVNQSMERSQSKMSFASQSTMSIASSVFDDTVKDPKSMDPRLRASKGRGPSKGWGQHKDREQDRYDEDESRESNDPHAMYSKVDKKRKGTAMQTQTEQPKMTSSGMQHSYADSTTQSERRPMASTGTQHDSDDTQSMISMQESTTQTMRSTSTNQDTQTIMNRELKNMVQKQRNYLKTYEDDTMSEATTAPRDSRESEYMQMNTGWKSQKERVKEPERPIPSPRRTSSSSNRATPTQRGTPTRGFMTPVTENDDSSTIGGEDYRNLTPTQQHQGSSPRGQSPSSQKSRSDRPPSTGSAQYRLNGVAAEQVPGGIRVNTIPGKPGSIEVQYGGYGGAPITIQFDTQGQYTVDSQGQPVNIEQHYEDGEPGYLIQPGVEGNDEQQNEYSQEQEESEMGYGEQQGNEYEESFQSTAQTGMVYDHDPYHEQEYGQQDFNTSMDTTADMETPQHHAHQPGVVRSTIKQTIVEATTDKHKKKPKLKPRGSKKSDQPQGHVEVVQQGQVPPGPAPPTYQEARQQSQTANKKPPVRVKPVPMSQTQPQQQAAPPKPHQYSKAVSVEEHEVQEPSPDTTPNSSPKYKSFSQALAFARKVEQESSPQSSPQFLRKNNQSNLVSTPESAKWKTNKESGKAVTVVESANYSNIRRQHQPTPKSAARDSSYLASMDVAELSNDEDDSDSDQEDSSEDEDVIQEESSKDSLEDKIPETQQQTYSEQKTQNKLAQQSQSHDLYYTITPGLEDQDMTQDTNVVNNNISKAASAHPVSTQQQHIQVQEQHYQTEQSKVTRIQRVVPVNKPGRVMGRQQLKQQQQAGVGAGNRGNQQQPNFQYRHETTI